MEQQIIALHAQLAEANSQIGLMAISLDTLRQETGTAVRELHRLLAEAKPVEGKVKSVNFVNTKVFEGGKSRPTKSCMIFSFLYVGGGNPSG